MAVKITAKSVVPTAIGAEYPIQKWIAGSMTLQPPVPMTPPSTPAASPMKTRGIALTMSTLGPSPAANSPLTMPQMPTAAITASSTPVGR